MNCPFCDEMKGVRVGVLFGHIRHMHTDYEKALADKTKECREAGLKFWEMQDLISPIRNEYKKKVEEMMKEEGLI